MSYLYPSKWTYESGRFLNNALDSGEEKTNVFRTKDEAFAIEHYQVHHLAYLIRYKYTEDHQRIEETYEPLKNGQYTWRS